MPLSSKEITELIGKLRSKYDEYAFSYSPKYFDRGAFDQRLKFAEKNKMNLEAFILAEIANFENVKAEYEKKAGKGEYSRKVDNMIEAQLRAVAKYPSVKIHPLCGAELPHFVGAVEVLLENYLPVLWGIITDSVVKDCLIEIESELGEFAHARGDRLPKKCEDMVHLFTYAGLKDVEVEKIRNVFMKECSFRLHDALDLCVGLLEIRDPQMELPVRFEKIHQSADRISRISSVFSGYTGYGCVIKINEYIDTLISDFRLSAFRRRS